MNTIPPHVRSITMMGRRDGNWQAAVWYGPESSVVFEAKTLDHLMAAIEQDIKRKTPSQEDDPQTPPPSVA